MSFLFWFFLVLIVTIILLILRCNAADYESISSYFSLTKPKRKQRYQIYNSNQNTFYYSNRRPGGYFLDGAGSNSVKFAPRQKIIDEKKQRTDFRMAGNPNVTPKPTYPKPKPVEAPPSQFPDIRKEKGGFSYKPAKLRDISHASASNSREQSPIPKQKNTKPPKVISTGGGRAYDMLFDFD